MSLDKLYDSVIRKHNSHPYHYEKKESCQYSIQAHNFICGDRFDLCLQIDTNVISSIHFYGLGCAVSKASASVLAQNLEGKSMNEAKAICDQFIRVLDNKLGSSERLVSDEFKSFGVVHEIQSRYDCAALVWMEVAKFLDQ